METSSFTGATPLPLPTLIEATFHQVCGDAVSWFVGFQKIHHHFSLFCAKPKTPLLHPSTHQFKQTKKQNKFKIFNKKKSQTFSSSFSQSCSSLLLPPLLSVSLVGDLKALFTTINHELPLLLLICSFIQRCFFSCTWQSQELVSTTLIYRIFVTNFSYSFVLFIRFL